MGMGIKKTSTVVINNTEKGNREVTEEDKKQAELHQQRTATFLSGIFFLALFFFSVKVAKLIKKN